MELLESPNSAYLNEISGISDHLPSLISKFRPVYSTPEYDVSILSSSFRRNTFSPRKLTDTAVAFLSEQLELLDKHGFKPNGFIKVLIGAHPDAIRTIGVSTFWQNSYHVVGQFETSAFVGGVGNLFIAGVPGFFRSWIPFYDFVNIIKNVSTQFLVFPAYSNTTHSLDNATMAHELAHTTEPQESHKSRIWKEARADVLSFLLTDVTHFS